MALVAGAGRRCLYYRVYLAGAGRRCTYTVCTYDACTGRLINPNKSQLACQQRVFGVLASCCPNKRPYSARVVCSRGRGKQIDR